MVLKDECLEDFLKTLVLDSGISTRIRLLIGFLFTGGLRVSEALKVKKSDVSQRGDLLVASTLVLKKKMDYEVRRDVLVHPLLKPLLMEVMGPKNSNEFIFNIAEDKKGRVKRDVLTRQRAHYFIKKSLGIDCHSLRHSNISYLMSKKLTDIEISKVLEMSVKNVANYTHVNQIRVMKDVYGA